MTRRKVKVRTSDKIFSLVKKNDRKGLTIHEIAAALKESYTNVYLHLARRPDRYIWSGDRRGYIIHSVKK